MRLELEIHALSSDGDGVARAPDGRVVFVPFTAPGDRVLARVEHDRKRFVRARVERLIRPGPERTDPVCAVFGSCGGCTWQHVRYEAQLEAKRAILRDALARVGGLQAPAEIPFTPSPSPWAYRSRARVLVHEGRVGFRRRRSHALCQTDRCPVLAPALDKALAALARTAPAPDGEWELAAGGGGTSRVVSLPVAEDAEAPSIELAVGKRRLRVSAGVFAQSNGLLLDPLVEAVESVVGRGAFALELHAGAGLFTLGLAERFERVLAVESDPRAVRDLRHNLGSALGKVDVLAQQAERAVERPEIRRTAPDLILVDPPRSGLGAGLAAALAALHAPRFVYLSCDPATLARDAATLAGHGYALTELRGFDLFPQTPHVEALAVLEPGRAPGAA